MFWSAERVGRWERAISGDQDTETLGNLMCLGPMAHYLWGQCQFAVKPIELSTDRKSLKAQFFWLPDGKYIKRNLQARPVVPGNTYRSAWGTLLAHNETERFIRSGDVVTFSTQDPDKYPLPSFDLLDMQWALHRATALSGVADATDEDLDPDGGLG